MNKIQIKKLDFPVDGYSYIVRVLTSTDGGKSWQDAGIGKYAKTWYDALDAHRELKSEHCAADDTPPRELCLPAPVSTVAVQRRSKQMQKQTAALLLALIALYGIVCARYAAQQMQELQQNQMPTMAQTEMIAEGSE